MAEILRKYLFDAIQLVYNKHTIIKKMYTYLRYNWEKLSYKNDQIKCEKLYVIVQLYMSCQTFRYSFNENVSDIDTHIHDDGDDFTTN